MDRRRFLAKLSALSAVGLAGCPGGDDGGTDTPGGTDDGADTSAPTPTETRTDSPMATATRSPADTDEFTPTPTATASEPDPTPTPDPRTPTPTDEPATPTPTDGPGPTPVPGADTDLPALETDGKWVVDEDGNEVVLRGLATAEPRYVENVSPELTWLEALQTLLDESEAWYTGVVRIPVTVSTWGEEADGPTEYAENFLDDAVDLCAERNTYVIIDHHLATDQGDYDTDRMDDWMTTFWDEIAPRYADRDHVLYEMLNEPTLPVFEDDRETWSHWKDVAQPWVDLIQDHAPERPLIVGSPEWTSYTHMAPQDPFEGDNLIYAGHIYPDNGAPEEFDDTYGAPAEEVPVMITEFGWSEAGIASVDEGTTSGWGQPFKEWVESYPNMGWQGWCYDPYWAPKLVDEEWTLKGGDAFAGHFLKEWLYEKRDDRVPDAMFDSDVAYEGPDDETPPPAPTDVSASEGESEREFDVGWQGVDDPQTSTQFYRVYVNGDLHGVSTNLTVTLNGTPGETYEVTVTAVDALSNESEHSEAVTYEVPGELSFDADIAAAETAPSVDADVGGAWEGVTEHALENELIQGIDGPDDLSATWRALWDDDALYLIVDVTDDALESDSGSQFNDDSVEVFVDADNSKGGSYDNENDFQFSFPWNGEEIQGQFPAGANPNEDVEWAQTDTDAGYRVEAALPWSLLSVSPSAGHAMGLDVHVNDDDTGGERDAKLAWYGEEDVAWEDTSALATVQLTE